MKLKIKRSDLRTTAQIERFKQRLRDGEITITRRQARKLGLIADSERRVYFYRHEARANGAIKRILVKPGALVKHPREAVEIEVAMKHATFARDHDGCGNANRCTISNAIADNADKFPHKVTGTVMTGRSAIYIVATEDDQGRPKTAYRYSCRARSVNGEVIDVVNDDSQGGLNRLVRQLEAHGPVTLRLVPRNRDGEKYIPAGGTGRITHERTPGHATGARRRFIDSVSGVGSTPLQEERA